MTTNEKELIKRAQLGDIEARNEIILNNQGLVMMMANKYKRVTYFDVRDLINEGNLALIKAIKLFDADLGCEFSTYATVSISRRITYFLNTNKNIVRCPLSKSKEAVEYVSLNTKINEDSMNSAELIDLLQSNDNVEEISMKRLYAEDLMKILKIAISDNLITEREVIIIMKKYGIIDDKPKTYATVGKEMGFSKQRATQIGTIALKKIRRILMIYSKNDDDVSYAKLFYKKK